jgi:hypothetical protein
MISKKNPAQSLKQIVTEPTFTFPLNLKIKILLNIVNNLKTQITDVNKKSYP